MKKVRRLFPLSVLLFTLSLVVAASAFAALGEGWHDNLGTKQSRTQVTKQSFYVSAGGILTVGVDQYAKNASGNYDPSKSPTVRYYIHNEAKASSTDYDFIVYGNKGGSTGAVAYTSQEFKLTGGYYTIYAENLSNFPVATGGNTYYTYK